MFSLRPRRTSCDLLDALLHFEEYWDSCCKITHKELFFQIAKIVFYDNVQAPWKGPFKWVCSLCWSALC